MERRRVRPDPRHWHRRRHRDRPRPGRGHHRRRCGRSSGSSPTSARRTPTAGRRRSCTAASLAMSFASPAFKLDRGQAAREPDAARAGHRAHRATSTAGAIRPPSPASGSRSSRRSVERYRSEQVARPRLSAASAAHGRRETGGHDDLERGRRPRRQGRHRNGRGGRHRPRGGRGVRDHGREGHGRGPGPGEGGRGRRRFRGQRAPGRGGGPARHLDGHAALVARAREEFGNLYVLANIAAVLRRRGIRRRGDRGRLGLPARREPQGGVLPRPRRREGDDRAREGRPDHPVQLTGLVDRRLRRRRGLRSDQGRRSRPCAADWPGRSDRIASP